MFNLAIWKFLLVDSGGALVWAGAYIGWLAVSQAIGRCGRRNVQIRGLVWSRFGGRFVGVSLL
jgi:hypothetical protein